MVTTVLEFLPGFVSTILAGNMDSPYAQHYVDAATVSIMVRSFTRLPTIVVNWPNRVAGHPCVQLMNISALSIGLGLASALDTLCSQAYGAKRFEKIGIYFQTGILVLATVLVPMFVINSFAEPILLSLGQDEEVSRLARDFSRLMLPGLPFLFLYELVRKVLQAQNILKPLVMIAVAGNVVNAVAGYLLAFHTSIGFNGIAIARSLGNMTLPVLLVPYFCWHPEHLRQWWCRGWDFKDALTYVSLFLRLGFPGMLMMAVEMWAFEILSILAGLLPDSVVALAIHATLMNVIMLVWTIWLGFSVAANIRVGNCLGANMPKKAKLACQLSLAMTFSLSLVVVAFLYGFSRRIPRLFMDDDDSVALASHVMAVWSPFEIADAINAVVQGVFRGAGRQKPAAITNVVAYYVGGIPLGVLLGFQFDLGVKGLWLGVGSGMVATVSVLLFLMLHYWKWDKLADDAQKRTAQ
ncbi:hypothetical protein BBJ28_00021262 [Nothophytophthora sp. Chile5]|nr:hypothetical protein BBJ28_00021262 [Nothophytophthora sp. Chile5]